MVDAGHGIEEVRRRSGTGRVAGPRGVQIRAGVAERDGHFPTGKPRDEVDGTRQLGCDRDHPQPVQHRLQRFARHVRRDAEGIRVMRALPVDRQERPLEVEAERLGAVGRRGWKPGPDAIGEAGECVERRAHRRRQEAGDATGQQCAAHAVEIVDGRHRVVAAETVDVDVAEAGRDQRCRRAGCGVGIVNVHASDESVRDRQPSQRHAVVEDNPSLERDRRHADRRPVSAYGPARSMRTSTRSPTSDASPSRCTSLCSRLRPETRETGPVAFSWSCDRGGRTLLHEDLGRPPDPIPVAFEPDLLLESSRALSRRRFTRGGNVVGKAAGGRPGRTRTRPRRPRRSERSEAAQASTRTGRRSRRRSRR